MRLYTPGFSRRRPPQRRRSRGTWHSIHAASSASSGRRLPRLFFGARTGVGMSSLECLLDIKPTVLNIRCFQGYGLARAQPHASQGEKYAAAFFWHLLEIRVLRFETQHLGYVLGD